MASEQVKAGFRARGIVPIPVAAGRRWFMDELAYGPRKDVELVAGQGPWEFARAVSASHDAPTTETSEARLPLIRGPLRVGAGGAVLFDHVLSLREDPYLSDHRLDGKPVLPAATALEYIAQFVAAGWPEWQVIEIRDLRAFSGIVLEADEAERALLLRARASTHSEAGTQAVTVELIDSTRKSPNYRATVVLGLAVPEAPMADLSPLVDGMPLDAKAMYAEHLFHGPQFQTVTAVASMGESGIDATVVASSPKSLLGPKTNAASWLFDFGLVDTAPQLALVWARIHRGKTALPSSFASVKRYGREPITGTLRSILRMKPAIHEAGVRYDVQFIDDNGRVRIAILDAEATMSTALNRLAGSS